MRYTRFFGTFLANSATTTLQFASTTPGAYGIVLDAVSVTAVPGAADTMPPVIQLTTAAPAGPVGQNVTFAGRATDDGTGVARLRPRSTRGRSSRSRWTPRPIHLHHGLGDGRHGRRHARGRVPGR